MATFTPTITNSSSITITTGTALTYNQLLQSIASGGFQIKIKGVYILASSYAQLANSWYFIKYSQDGAYNVYPDAYQLDVNQFQPSAFWDFSGVEYVVDNLTNINIQLLANSSLDMIFYVDYITNLDAYKGNSGGEKLIEVTTTTAPKNIDVKVQSKDENWDGILLGMAAIGAAIYIVKKL